MRSSRCLISSSDLGVDGHTITPGYEYDAAKKDMIKRLNLQPENFFLTRGLTVEKFNRMEEWMQPLHVLRDTGVFRVPRWKTGPHLFGVGDPDPEHSRLESALLFHDRRWIQRATTIAMPSCSSKCRLEQIRRGQRRG